MRRFSALFFSPLRAAETEVFLEEGNVEIELSNGVFIALSAGADVRIVHEEDGAPKMIEIRAGFVQVISSFVDPSDMVVRLGASALTLGKGAAIFSAQPEGGMEAILLNGSPFDLKGGKGKGVRPGDRLRVDGKGEVRKDQMSKGQLKGRGRNFGKPPPKQKKRERGSNQRSGARPVGEDAGLEGPVKPPKKTQALKTGPKLKVNRPNNRAPKPPQSVDTAVREMTDKAKNALNDRVQPQPAPAPGPGQSPAPGPGQPPAPGPGQPPAPGPGQPPAPGPGQPPPPPTP